MSLTIKQREALQEQGDSVEVYILTFGTTILRFTSYFEAITIGDDEYAAIPLQRSGAAFNSDLSDITIELTMALNTAVGNFFLGTSQIEDCTIEIRKYFLADLTVYDVVLSGFVKAPAVDAGILKISCCSWLNLINNEFPRLRFQARCNNKLFDSVCGLVQSAWALSGVVTSISGTNLVITNAGAPAAYAIYRNYVGRILEHVDVPINNFFTEGKLIATGSGNSRMIIAHTNLSINVDEIRLQFPLDELSVGDPVQLLPGCSKTYDSNAFACCNFCKSFRSGASSEIDTINHYLGMTQIPYKNPTLTPIQGS